MACNKVIFCGEPIIDLTNDTVTEDTLLFGNTVHTKNGELVVGKLFDGFPKSQKIIKNTEPNSPAEVEEATECNKVIFCGETLIDLSADTSTTESILAGYTAHLANGKTVVGTFLEDYPESKELTDSLCDDANNPISDGAEIYIDGRVIYEKQPDETDAEAVYNRK